MPELTIAQFKNRIRLGTAALLLGVVSLSVWSIRSEYRGIVTDAERTATGYARALSEHAESALAESDRVLKDLIHDIGEAGPIDRLDSRRLFELLSRQSKGSPQIGMIFLVNRQGMLYMHSTSFPPRQVSVADREYFRQYLAHPETELYLSNPLISRLTGQWRFNLMRPLRGADGAITNLAAVAFNTDYFGTFFNTENLGKGGRVLLIRNDGVPLVHEPASENGYDINFSGTPLFQRHLPVSPAGVYHLSDGLMHKEPRIVAYRRLSRFPLVAVVSLDRDEVLAAWYRKSVPYLLLIGALCGAALLLVRTLFRHLDRLHAARQTVIEQQHQLASKAAQIDEATDAILQTDAKGNLLQFNQALCAMTGYSAEELTGRSLRDIHPPAQSALIDDNLRHILQHGDTILEADYLTKQGETIPIEGHARLVRGADGSPQILNIVRDISQRKRAEQRERTRLAILEEMATGTPLEQLLIHIVQFVEQESAGALCSVLLADETGQRLLHGAAPSLPEAYNRAVDGLRIAPDMGSCGTAAHTLRRVVVEDIETHPHWRGFQPARDAGLKACWSQPILSSGRELLGTFAIYYRETRSPRPEEIQLIESAAHLAGIAIDRAREESLRTRLEEQLLHVQKIDAIGQLAGGIAHDFNNLLTPVIVYSDLLSRNLRHDPEMLKKSEGVLAAAHKARELTQKLLSFGRKQMLSMMPHDLNDIIRSFFDILRSTVREEISLELLLSDQPAVVLGDRGQLEQILLNLALNAQDATTDKGAIRITTGHAVLDDEFVRLHPGMKPGPAILLTFTDSGRGMDDATLAHIFEPFFTTKPAGHGTGLGLATVYGIVKQHDGYITVTSSVGQGTTFRIYLQQHGGEPVREPERESANREEFAGQAGPERTVLVVEDNDMVRQLLREVLRPLRYRVLVAAEPLQALELAAGHPGDIDLLISDVVMPGLNGRELYERLVADRPGLPVLFISGHTRDVIVSHGTLEEDMNFLHKPFTTEELVFKVAAILNREDGTD